MHIALVGAEFEENLAIRYLWAALEHAGHRVTQIVFNRREDIERAAHQLVHSDAALAGFSMVFTHRARQFAALATRARELGYRGHIVAGGHFAAFHAESLLTDVPAFDSVALGEGEALVCALAAALEPTAAAGEPLTGLAGLVWRRERDVVRNPPAKKPADLDTLAAPPRKSPFDNYLGVPISNILSSRGCSHRCAFCSIAAWHAMCGGPRLRLRSPERVADEMAALHARGVRIFNFHDDNFFPPKRADRYARVRSLGKALAARGLGDIAFAVKSRPDVVEPELFRELQQMGLFRVFLGIEAGTTESLEHLGRHQRLEDNEQAIAVLNELDIHTCFNLLMWNPYSTFDDVCGNVAFLRSHPRNPMNFCRTEIYTGTPLEHALRQEGRLRGDYWGWDYRIEDERAQRAFEIAYRCFEQRNYGDDGAHHLAMQVDYEHQLAARLFGTEPALRRAVKRFIIDVNLDTVAHLEAIFATVRLETPTRAEQLLIIDERLALVGAADVELRRRAHTLLTEIRTFAQHPSANVAPWKRRAAAGLAASLAVAAACQSCGHATEMVPMPVLPVGPGDTHPSEMAPMPPDDAGAPQPPGDPLIILPDDGGATEPDPTHMSEMVARPPDADGGAFAPLGLMPQPLYQEARAIVARYVEPQPTELELWFDGAGAVSRIALRASKIDAPAIRRAGQELSALHSDDPDVRGQRFLLTFSAEALAAAASTPVLPPSHPREMAPRPPRPPTHPTEKAPRPPEHFSEMAPMSTWSEQHAADGAGATPAADAPTSTPEAEQPADQGAIAPGEKPGPEEDPKAR